MIAQSEKFLETLGRLGNAVESGRVTGETLATHAEAAADAAAEAFVEAYKNDPEETLKQLRGFFREGLVAAALVSYFANAVESF